MIRREDQDRVRILRLDNPPGNLLTLALLWRLREEIAAAREDRAVGCLVLASGLPKYFSTGLDLDEWTALPEKRRSEPFVSLIETFRALEALPTPTIASLNGSAILGGWILAMACDFRLIARERGRIALSEIRLGLSPTSGLIRKLASMARNPNDVKQMVLRGKTLRAQEALSAGLVDAVYPAEDLWEATLKEAHSLCRLSPPAYAAVKDSLRRLSGEGSDAVWAESFKDLQRLLAHPLTAEGMAAMKEKRRPRWEAAA